MKKLFALLLIATLIFPPSLWAATGCNYPSSLDGFSDKSTGDQVSVADWNTRSCAIEKIEAELGVNPSGTYSTVVARLNELLVTVGLSGGQTATGDTASGGALKLSSTFHATKGKIWLGTGSTLGASSAYDEANVKLGIGTQSPVQDIDIVKNTNAGISVLAAGTGVFPVFQGTHPRGTVASPTATQAGDALMRLQGVGRGATGYTGAVAAFDLVANQNFTDSAQGTYSSLSLTPDGSTTAGERYRFRYDGFRIGSSGNPDTSLHLALNTSSHAAITFEESTANPADPSSGSQARFYMKGDKAVIQYNHAGTIRYHTLDLTGTPGGQSWISSTTPP